MGPVGTGGPQRLPFKLHAQHDVVGLGVFRRHQALTNADAKNASSGLPANQAARATAEPAVRALLSRVYVRGTAAKLVPGPAETLAAEGTVSGPRLVGPSHLH
mmetsp:Transcript_22892/g.43065  ORF Transcript_22892/g.43065 Transcript_22892/m.43065 type:complete len:103 (+) Transcript_22892:480-788(+)